MSFYNGQGCPHTEVGSHQDKKVTIQIHLADIISIIPDHKNRGRYPVFSHDK